MIDAFWLTTLVPGFALLQSRFPQDLRRGLLPTLTWSFLLTVALMAPVVVLAFVAHFSVGTVGVIYFIVVLAGGVSIRRSGLGTLARMFRQTHWFEVGLVLGVIALTVPLGGAATDDSLAHAAKIRFMRDVGFYLQDPYSPLSVIETKWHVSVYHGFFAIESWIGGGEPLDLWFRSAWFFRLLGLGGIGFFAMTVFRSRWVSTVAMIGALVVLGTKKSIVYPFSVTAWAVFPVLLALFVEMLERPSARRYVRIVLCGLTLAVTHVGTWLLAALCLGPTVAAWAVWRRGLRQSWRPLAWALAALVPGIPMVLVSALQPNHVDAQQDVLHAWMLRTIDVGLGWPFRIVDPVGFSWMLSVAVGMVLLLLIAPRLRPRLLILSAVLSVAMVFMFTPGLFDLLTSVIPYWLVWRFRFVGEAIGFVVLAGGLAWITRRMLPTRRARQALAALVLCGGVAVFRVEIEGYVVDRARHRIWLQNARELQDAVRAVVPAHSLVAADPQWSLVLPAVHLARVMGEDLHHANPADGGLLERYAEAQELLAEGTSTGRRQEIITKNGIDFIIVHNERRPGDAGAFEDVGDVVSSQHGFRVYKLRQ